MPNRKPEALLWLVDAHGVYIPQAFAESFADRAASVSGISDEDWATLEAGPDSTHYWEVWEHVLDHAKVKLDGKPHSIHQDGDVWLIPEGMVWSEENDFFLWPAS
jgi:hypothetical protein